MRKLLVPVLALAVTAGSALPALGATRIRVGDNYFVRAGGVPTVKVDKGTRVKWVFRGDSPHNVKVEQRPRLVRLLEQDVGLVRQDDDEEGHLPDLLLRPRRRRPEHEARRPLTGPG